MNPSALPESPATQSPRSHRGRRPPATPRLQVTAMIDVVFLLLVYFVVTASFSVDEGVIAADLPAEAPPDQPPALPVRVAISSVGEAGYRLRLEGYSQTPRSFTELARALADLRRGLPADAAVVIEPKGPVRWQHALDAFNAAVKAKFKHVSFAVVEPGEG